MHDDEQGSVFTGGKIHHVCSHRPPATVRVKESWHVSFSFSTQKVWIQTEVGVQEPKDQHSGQSVDEGGETTKGGKCQEEESDEDWDTDLELEGRVDFFFF